MGGGRGGEEEVALEKTLRSGWRARRGAAGADARGPSSRLSSFRAEAMASGGGMALARRSCVMAVIACGLPMAAVRGGVTSLLSWHSADVAASTSKLR